MTTPVAKISLSFQLSGIGEGLTLSFDIVIIVPVSNIEIRTKKKIMYKEGQHNSHHKNKTKFSEELA